MAQLEISVMAMGRPGTSASEYVAGAIEVARQSGLKYQVTAMGTILEGDTDSILQVARRMHEAPFSKGIRRVYSVIKLDDRRDKESTLEGKVASVTGKLGAG